MDAVKIVRANTDSSSRSPYVSAYLWDEWHAKVFFSLACGLQEVSAFTDTACSCFLHFKTL